MTNQSIFERWMSQAIEKFRTRTPKSSAMYENTQKYLPGGDTRTTTFFRPYPIFIDRGEECRVYDLDGYPYIDFSNNYTVLIHGHAHPAVTKATVEQMKRGSCFAGPTKNQGLLAELICERVKSVERIRFCNSGTEATMMAIRTARIFTGKSKIVKMEGGYHGTHDLAEVSFTPSLEEVGPVESPKSVPQSRGIPKSILQEVIVVPFNNKEVTEKKILEHQGEIACVIVEPMLGAAGLISQENGYLEFLRDLTRKLGILLIFDEIITFRLGPGGAQGIYGIEPDLTTFAKIIGGGFPVGAFGGSKEVMKIFSPSAASFVTHAGTFNGNPMTMVAGIACLKELTQDVFNRINSLGEYLRKGMAEVFHRNGINGQVMGIGSLVQPHFNSEKIIDYRSAKKGNPYAMALLHLGLLEKGIHVVPRGLCSISTPMAEKEMKAFLTAFEESLIEIKPFIEETSAELVQ